MQRAQDKEPIDSRLLRMPLDVIAETHLREREICARVDRLALADKADPEDLRHVLRFLREDLPLHMQDEEEDLFPLLRRRCDPEEEIEKVIERLLANHEQSLANTAELIATLQNAEASGRALDAAERAQLSTFAAHARRHLIVENAIILPIARGSLTPSDLTTLSLRMRKRRGLDQPAEESHAE